MENKIKQIHQQIRKLEEDLKLKKNLLFREIDQTLSKNPPFKGNTTFEEDIESYKLLVNYAELLNNRTLIIDWGIKPLNNHYPLLHKGNRNFDKYREFFEGLCLAEHNSFKRSAYWELSDYFDYMVSIEGKEQR